MTSTRKEDYSPIISTAYKFARQHIDLTSPPIIAHNAKQGPKAYYYFLAGFVALLRCTRILEIGARYGGSIFSMARGVECAGLSSSAEIITVDKVNFNPEEFRKAKPLVKLIVGNCFHPTTMQAVISAFSGRVDLLFIDISHSDQKTRHCLEGYVRFIAPRLILLDDIKLNAEMSALWNDLVARYGDNAIDISRSARRTQGGLGLLVS